MADVSFYGRSNTAFPATASAGVITLTARNRPLYGPGKRGERGVQRRNKAHLCFPAAFVRISTRNGAGVRDETTNSVKGYGLRSPQAYNIGPFIFFFAFFSLFLLIFGSVPLFSFEFVEQARTGGQPCRAVER